MKAINRPFKAWRALTVVLLFAALFLLGGGSDMIEIQDRDFALALGVSYEEGMYKISYVLPDLASITGNGNSDTERLVRTYSAASFREIEELYNLSGNKRLDYRHLQAVVLDESIKENPQVLQAFAEYISENNQVSRNVLAFYTEESLDELLHSDTGPNGNIGIYLSKMESNNYEKYGSDTVTVGALIDSLFNDKVVSIPVLTLRDQAAAMDGCALFRRNTFICSLSEQEFVLYYLLQEKGHENLLRLSENFLIKITEIDNQVGYSYVNQVPSIYIHMGGSAEFFYDGDTMLTMEALEQLISETLQQMLEEQAVTLMKEAGIDYLGLYDKSALKSRSMWLAYRDNTERFLKDIVLGIEVDMKLESAEN